MSTKWFEVMHGLQVEWNTNIDCKGTPFSLSPTGNGQVGCRFVFGVLAGEQFLDGFYAFGETPSDAFWLFYTRIHRYPKWYLYVKYRIDEVEWL